MMSMSIVQLLEEIRHCPESVQDEETRLWHSWLFEGTRADIEIRLWESAYRDDRKVLLDQVTLDVAMCYYAEHLGWNDPHIPADDICLELEFFLQLISRSAYVRAADFFSAHLKNLVRQVFCRVERCSGSIYYSDLAKRALELTDRIDDLCQTPEHLKTLSAKLPDTLCLVPLSEREIKKRKEMRTVYTTGRGNCGGKCELEAVVSSGCVLDLHSCNRETSLTLPPCARGRSYRGTYLNAGRLRYPMIRIGERGEGIFRRISWTQALDMIEEKLTTLTQKYGPGCRYVNYSSGVCSQISGDFMLRRMLGLAGGYLGVMNSYSSACITYTLPYVFGTFATGSSLSSFSETNLVILWGNNPLVTEYCKAWIDLLKTFRERKTRIISIDPHYNETARYLNAEWIPILPDTDAALASAMAYVLWEEGLCDREFMNTYCLGFDAEHMPEGMEREESYQDYIFGIRDGIPKDPAWAADITGIPEERIRSLAREYAAAKPGAILAGRGCQRTAGGEQNVRSIALLSCMTGSVGKRGGGTGYNMFLPQHKAPSYPFGDNPYGGRIPAFLWTDAILDGKHMTREKDHIAGREQLDSDIKILFNLAGNCMLNQHSNSNRTAAILKDTSKCEFVVVSDLFMTASARYADLLLPGTSMFEDAYISKPWGEGDYLLYAEQVIEPYYESRFEGDWILELEKRLGITGTAEGHESVRDWYRGMYERVRNDEPELPDYDTFCKTGGYRFQNNPEHIAFAEQIFDPVSHPFPTDSGKIEIFSVKLAQMKDPEIPAVPKYTGGFEGVSDPVKKRYPLQLIGWHTRRRCHSIGDPNPELEKLEPQRLWMHPKDAAERGITQNSLAEVYNDRGVVRIRVHITEEIMQGVVCLPQGAWFTPDENGIDIRGCVNTLTTSKPTALAKANPQHSCLVQVRTIRGLYENGTQK